MRLTFKSILAAAFLVVCLSSCTSHLLKLHTKPYYSELNAFSIDSTLNMFCQVCYNKPHVLDEEYCYYLNINVNNRLVTSLPVVLSLADSSNVKSTFSLASVWGSGQENAVLSGSIKILKLTDTTLTTKLNIRVRDAKGKSKYAYKGTRTFQNIFPH